jgi:hypothetical protein
MDSATIIREVAVVRQAFFRLGMILGLTLAAAAKASETGNYVIAASGNPDWTLGCGWTGSSDKGIEGADVIGPYVDTTIHLQSHGVPLTGKIRWYQNKTLAMFSLTYEAAAAKPLLAFPDFDRLPKNFHVMSFRQKAHSPVAFEPVDSGSPWMIFDDDADAFIISPASHFLIQSIGGDGRTHIVSELRDTVRNIPAGFTQQTLVAYGKGINRTWDLFGQTLTELQGKTRPANDCDIGLKYLGYWTDNGTHYYYNFDPKLGYGGTLLALAQHFREKGIPVKYVQLDSWWYYKSSTGPDGKPGKTKNLKMPPGEWNRYGGLMEYRAHPDVFPQGLEAFQRKLGLPIMTHNRWIDPASPYHQSYEIAGFAATDPRYWHDIVGYVHGAGAFAYEQDWLSEIYLHSPQLAATVDAGDEFLTGMATACREDGMTMQYCMPFPCHFLQGSRYSNLTTIRTSEDRLRRDRWHDFLYGSRLASAMGIWPWTDAYLSSETANLLLSDLSGGIVGIGDEIGKEDKENILKAVRADGVIVKPDVPIVPLDGAYIAEAQGESPALVASTYTDHGGLRTEYVLAYRLPTAHRRSKEAPPEDLKAKEHLVPAEQSDVQYAAFSMRAIGVKATAYLYDYFNQQAYRVDPDAAFRAPLGKDGFSYYVIAQPGICGIALFGDAGKFVSSGKQRIASLHQEPKKLAVDVIFAQGEKSIRLHGCCPSPVKASVAGHTLDVSYDSASQHFAVDVNADGAAAKDGALTTEVILEIR